MLLGARRVGKTTLLRQIIHDVARTRAMGPVLFASLDTPIYADLKLDEFLVLFEELHSHDPDEPRLVIFDEIQYLEDWERHLKALVDRHPHTRFVASGSAGAALRRKSAESGAGRFTDFELPALTFSEYLDFAGLTEELVDLSGSNPRAKDFSKLNSSFVDYLNFGGYPEVVVNETIRQQLDRFVRSDIIQKVLLQDLPSLYGITNIPELNRLFSVLAYNSGQLVSLEGLSSDAGVSKVTIVRYLEYLEAAFLIVRVKRVDETARRFRRERNFKVYLTNPSMRAALFGPTADDDDAIGAVVETGLVTQYLHASLFRDLSFARWRKREIDLVLLSRAHQKPTWALEIKWSDRAYRSPEAWKSLEIFARKNGLGRVFMTSKTVEAMESGRGLRRVVRPVALVAYQVGALAASQELLRERDGLPFGD